jgi:Acetyl/propionyl-CoA carboxylase, alpha subunit
VSSLSEKRKVTVNGVEYEVEIQFDDGKWEVTIDGKLYEVEIDQGSMRGQRKKRDSNRGGSPSSGLISSAIPGKIVSVLVSEGDKVDSGSVVIVLEAMKMQNEIKAGIDGKVEKICANRGRELRRMYR